MQRHLVYGSGLINVLEITFQALEHHMTPRQRGGGGGARASDSARAPVRHTAGSKTSPPRTAPADRLADQRLIVNLAPAAVRKEGPAFDLPIAVGVLVTNGQLQPEDVEDAMIIGELSLDGSVRHVRGDDCCGGMSVESGLCPVFCADAPRAGGIQVHVVGAGGGDADQPQPGRGVHLPSIDDDLVGDGNSMSCQPVEGFVRRRGRIECMAPEFDCSYRSVFYRRHALIPLVGKSAS